MRRRWTVLAAVTAGLASWTFTAPQGTTIARLVAWRVLGYSRTVRAGVR